MVVVLLVVGALAAGMGVVGGGGGGGGGCIVEADEVLGEGVGPVSGGVPEAVGLDGVSV
jgi:hypothetical protein